MIDLHTHILPGIDDGARTLEESIKLLRMEIDSGVRTVALTPHYKPNPETLKDFLRRRQDSYKRLLNEVEKQGLNLSLILGAEVAYSPNLLDLDISELCYEGTKTILIELPMDHYPSLTREIFYRLMLDGYTPLIAHAERYTYFARNIETLEELVDSGALVQVNANGLLRFGKTRKRVINMIEMDLVHIVATDTHSTELRPPRLGKAKRIVEQKIDKETAQRLVNYKL